MSKRIKTERALKIWKEESLNLKADSTADMYQRHLNKFLKYRGVTPNKAAKWDK